MWPGGGVIGDIGVIRYGGAQESEANRARGFWDWDRWAAKPEGVNTNLPLRRVRYGQPETSMLVAVELYRSLDMRSRAKLPTLDEPQQTFPNSPSHDHDPDNQESRHELLV